MPNRDDSDPYSGFNFLVEIDGVLAGAFGEVSGLGNDTEAMDYRDNGNGSQNGRKISGLRKFPNLTLKRGISQDESLWAWYRNSRDNPADKRKVTIVQRDEAGREIARWEASNAWIDKLQGPSFNATGNDIAIETIALGCEGLIVAP